MEWEPLEKFACNLYRSANLPVNEHGKAEFCGRFMFMGETQSNNKTYYLYKHIQTNRYLNLDEQANAFAYVSGHYIPTPPTSALCHASS